MRGGLTFFHVAVTSLLGWLLLSAPVMASNLPEALLKAPIHLISGDTVSLSEFQGEKPVYLKFWATWCQPCRKQMPHFEQVQKQYGDRIEVIGINLGLNDDLDSVREAIREFGLTMPMAIDRNGDLAQKFRLIGTPYHLLFDKHMNLVHRGHKADSSLDNKIAMVAMGEPKPGSVIDSSVLEEHENDIPLTLDDGRTHALFFTATWCDWYLKDSRPSVSRACVAAQKAVNAVAAKNPGVVWFGVINRLWTGAADVAEYRRKYSVSVPMQIDRSNRLFHQYSINDIPALLIIRDGKVVARIRDFADTGRITAALKAGPQ